MADRQKNYRAIFSALQQESLLSWSKEDQEWLLNWIESSNREIALTAKVHENLLNGARNEIFDQYVQPALSLKAIAEFLASLELANEDELIKIVKRGLSRFGMARHGRGRPRGRVSESHCSWWVDINRPFVEQCGILSKKTNLMKEYPRHWQIHFERLLEEEGWPSPVIHELAISETPDEFARLLATDYFNVSYEQVARACRRTKITARK